MKKFLLILAGTVFVLSVVVFFTALVISFKFVKQTTDLINEDLKNKFAQTIVRIPQEAHPTYRDFTTTIYSWEMETNQNEVTTVIFKHDTGFSPDQNIIVATLQMDQVGDPSLFNKVLPAVIADKQSLESAQNLQNPKLEANPQALYTKINLYNYEGRSEQVSKITWDYQRDTIAKDSQNLYLKLRKYPPWFIKALYTLQGTTLQLLSP